MGGYILFADRLVVISTGVVMGVLVANLSRPNETNTMKLIFAFLIILVLNGCTTMYSPNMLNVPMFEKKGEMKVLANLRNYQFAYSFSDNIGITTNGFYSKTLIDGPGSEDYSSPEREIKEIEIGAVYYMPVKQNCSFEVITGIGIGHSLYSFNSTKYLYTQQYKDDDVSQKSNFRKLYIQPNIVLFKEFALSTRIEYVDFYNIQEFHPFEDNVKRDLLINPAATYRAGDNKYSFVFQIQGSFPLKNYNVHNDWLYFTKHYMVSFGFEFHLDKIFNKK